MGSRVGIVICNYNKREYLLKCLASLGRQTFRDFSAYVVDNASTDGSAEAAEAAYGDAVQVIRLPENLGGAGGFNAGLRRAMGQGHAHFLLLDNDVALREDCLGELVAAMEGNRELGVLGCKILKMDEPDRIQEFGPVLDPENVTFILRYRGESDSLPLPDILPCDYVPACAMMVRGEALERVGLLPEERFIYYDDIEFCARCRMAGWQVAASARAKAWHKGGAAVQRTTFSVYYINRNKTRFYMGYFPEKFRTEGERMAAVRRRADIILRDMFEGCYVCRQQGQLNVLATRMDAFLDALEGRTGRAEPWKIRPHEHTYLDRFRDETVKAGRIALFLHGDEANASRVLGHLGAVGREAGQPCEVTLVDEGAGPGKELLGRPVLPSLPGDGARYGLALHVCRHVYKLDPAGIGERSYVDGWGNLLLDDGDRRRLREFRGMLEFFSLCHRDRLVQGMMECV